MKRIIFITVISINFFVTAQTTITKGNLLRINWSNSTINYSDTLGYWYINDRQNTYHRQAYFDKITTANFEYLLLYDVNADDYIEFNNWTSNTIESLTDGNRRQFWIEMHGWTIVLGPYTIFRAIPFKTENGVWLLNGTSGKAFISNDDGLYVIPHSESNLRFICGLVDTLTLTVHYDSNWENIFYLMDLSNSPELDTTSAIQVFFQDLIAPLKIRKLFANHYLIQNGYFIENNKLGLYKLEQDNFYFIKSFFEYINYDWEYKNEQLFVIREGTLYNYTFDMVDTTFFNEVIIAEGLGFSIKNYSINEDFKYLAHLKQDSIYVKDIRQNQLINSYHISSLSINSSPIIDSQYVYVHQITSITDVSNRNEIEIFHFTLEQNFPNPFNPTTKIKFTIPSNVILSEAKNLITLKVYDVLGNEIATLVNEEKSAGSYDIEFDAVGMQSGIYFYRIQAGSFFETKKMVLLK